MGRRTAHIVVDHVLGAVSASLIVVISTTFAFGILAEAALSYLGLGVQPPSASLGSMLTSAANLLNSAPQLTVEPGLVITLLWVVINARQIADLKSAMGKARLCLADFDKYANEAEKTRGLLRKSAVPILGYVVPFAVALIWVLLIWDART